jgi:hypothetical protein
MSRADIETYVKVGHNKRNDPPEIDGDSVDPNPKGRKGIGKLAALFLSPHFFLSTRQAGSDLTWELDARDGKVDDDAHPSLIAVQEGVSTLNDQLWSELSSGTRITMLGVDLTGYGKQAIAALSSKLANQFLLPQNASPRILLLVRNSAVDADSTYVPVVKRIAFGNFSEVMEGVYDSQLRPADLEAEPQELAIPAKGLPGGKYKFVSARSDIKIIPEQDEAWAEIDDVVDLKARTYDGVKFSLSGWIGIHATISSSAAQENDERFTKNRYYNPAEIRVYVRGKLASDRLLTQLGLTGTYVNYVEGELSFDLLDDDALPDIATSNRQDFDETDRRVTLLRALVRPLVRALIQRRNILAGVMREEAEREKNRRDTASKRQFSEQLHKDLADHEDIPQATRDELQMVITNKIQGDVAPKQSYRVFISHAKKDRAFAGLIDDLLRVKGARKDEIFYTSRTGSTEVLLDDRALSDVIKRNITDDNTLIFYMTSKNFVASQFCLFEGGAGWATRAVSQYLKLNVEYDSVPSWLSNGKGEAILLGSDNSISLTPEIHNYLVDGILNPMILHLNRGRKIANEPDIDIFGSVEFPSDLVMMRDGKSAADYFHPEIAESWTLLVEGQLTDYLSLYLKKEK